MRDTNQAVTCKLPKESRLANKACIVINSITALTVLSWYIEHGGRAVGACLDHIMGIFKALFHVESEFIQDFECLIYVMCDLSIFTIILLGEGGLFVKDVVQITHVMQNLLIRIVQ